MSTLTLIKHIRRRPRSLGIGTAADYLRELEVCLGGRCPSGLLDGISRRRWRGWLKAARRKLVYHHDEMRPVTEGVRLQASGVGRSAPDLLSPAPDACRLTPDALSLPPHTIASFPAVITTTRQDLDGDVLETAGAELDPRAPLLWQHLPDLPIGRLLDVGQRTERRLTGTFSIADTALGQDAALLAEHGALRISHGFLPTKWEPLDSDDAFAGYHILEFKILEVSLVSVPSNPDAVIEAFSRAKLAHPLVKAWAGTRFESRPVVVAGAGKLDQPTGGQDTETQRRGDAANLKSCPHVESPQCPCVSGSPCHAAPLTNSSPNGLQTMNQTPLQKAGRTLNAVNERRVRAARFHFKAIEHHDDSGDAVAELARKATLPLDDMLDQLDSDPDWHGDEEGDGDVPGNRTVGTSLREMEPVVNAASDAGQHHAERDGYCTKAGRVVSQENADRLAEAIQHGSAITQHEQATADVSALATGAVKHLKSVLDSDSQDDDGDMSYDGGNPTGCSANLPLAPGEGRGGGRRAAFDSPASPAPTHDSQDPRPLNPRNPHHANRNPTSARPGFFDGRRRAARQTGQRTI